MGNTVKPQHMWDTKEKTERALRDAEIAQMVVSGESVPAIADHFGISATTVYRMLKRTLNDLDAFRGAEIDDWRRALVSDLLEQLDAAREDSLTQPTEENGLSYGQAAKIRNMARVTMIKIHNQLGRYMPGLFKGAESSGDRKIPSIVIVGMPVMDLIPKDVAAPVTIYEGEIDAL